MTDKQKELRGHLQSALKELDRLSNQIRDTKDYSEQAELILCLKELVSEQAALSQHESVACENISRSADTIR